MGYKSLLRRQVKAELRLRRYIIYTFLLLSLLYVGAALVFSDTGLMRYREMTEKKASLKEELRALRHNNAKLQTSIKTLKKNDFYLEKHAREDFGLAGPDEYVFIFKD